MKIKKLYLSGGALIEVAPFVDNRGVFARFFCIEELYDIIGDRCIVNVNFSRTFNQGAIRGMHFQYPPKAEMKFVRCINGSVYDVIVDVRSDSATYLKWFGTILSKDNMNMICIPEGFAHGFQALEDNSEMLYLHTEFYSEEYEGGLNYADKLLGIDWPLIPTDISERDRNLKMVDDCFRGINL